MMSALGGRGPRADESTECDSDRGVRKSENFYGRQMYMPPESPLPSVVLVVVVSLAPIAAVTFVSTRRQF